MQKILVSSLAETRALGLAIGRALPPQAICLFYGELAAGKTTFIKALCEGMGVAADQVISPTYTISNLYHGKWPIIHVDLYRLDNSEALYNLDPEDWLNPAGPTFIEWPEIALPLLQGMETMAFRLHPVGAQESTQRHIEITTTGTIYEPLWEVIAPWKKQPETNTP